MITIDEADMIKGDGEEEKDGMLCLRCIDEEKSEGGDDKRAKAEKVNRKSIS
jgi:hypothetical protein